jgi:hypothetical protein
MHKVIYVLGSTRRSVTTLVEMPPVAITPQRKTVDCSAVIPDDKAGDIQGKY